jgi:hypothetical protein
MDSGNLKRRKEKGKKGERDRESGGEGEERGEREEESRKGNGEIICLVTLSNGKISAADYEVERQKTRHLTPKPFGC